MGFYYVKLYQLSDGSVMAAIADEEVMGRAAYDDETGASIIVSEEFYGGTLIGEEEVDDILRGADVLVLAGDRVIGKAVRMGLVHPDSILRIGDLSHVQVFKFAV